jgi:hypothetical protein
MGQRSAGRTPSQYILALRGFVPICAGRQHNRSSPSCHWEGGGDWRRGSAATAQLAAGGNPWVNPLRCLARTPPSRTLCLPGSVRRLTVDCVPMAGQCYPGGGESEVVAMVRTGGAGWLRTCLKAVRKVRQGARPPAHAAGSELFRRVSGCTRGVIVPLVMGDWAERTSLSG